MLNTRLTSKQAGMTLIEVMVVVVVLGILTAVAIPSFQNWMQNVKISTAAESVTSGIQRARAEAVRRNTAVAFNMGAASSWTISDVATGTVIESRSSHEGSKNVAVAAVAADLATPATTITFDQLGVAVQVVGSLAQIDFSAVGGSRNLRVTIGLGGNARMCNPNLSTGASAC
jgi:type IV fimbrial biogenesis protein FimT